jgi:hypothetical protein
MVWTTAVTAEDVRTEYPLLTVELCSDARVTANRDRAEAEIEAVLRDRYDLSDPGADKYVWRICLALTLYHCINSAYGEQGWTGEGRSAAAAYWQEWDVFKGDVLRSQLKLSLKVSRNIPTPTVGNFDLGKSAFSSFGLNKHPGPGFPFGEDDD